MGLVPLLPAAVFGLYRRRASARLTRGAVVGFGALNLALATAIVALGIVWFLNPPAVGAAGLSQESVGRDPMAYIGAAIAVGLGSLGAAYAVGNVGSAAVGAVAERPDIFGRALLFVGLAEGVAIYGLIIAFIMLG
jgi:V/A-type H+-transporting ATPase subunit K